MCPNVNKNNSIQGVVRRGFLIWLTETFDALTLRQMSCRDVRRGAMASGGASTGTALRLRPQIRYGRGACTRPEAAFQINKRPAAFKRKLRSALAARANRSGGSAARLTRRSLTWDGVLLARQGPVRCRKRLLVSGSRFYFTVTVAIAVMGSPFAVQVTE
jgi:hypothetical protein